MELSIKTTGVYTPEFNSNRDLPEDEQITITHKMPTVKINESLSNMRFSVGESGEVTGSAELTRRKVCGQFIKEIKNLSVNVDGKKKTIRTADDLFSDNAPAMLDALADELFKYFNDLRKQEVDEKN